MLILFDPQGWRTGAELKNSDQTWAEAFAVAQFSVVYRQMMDNMNLLYECYEASHDLAAQNRHLDRERELVKLFGEAAVEHARDQAITEQTVREYTDFDLLELIEASVQQESSYAKRMRPELENIRQEMLQMDI